MANTISPRVYYDAHSRYRSRETRVYYTSVQWELDKFLRDKSLDAYSIEVVASFGGCDVYPYQRRAKQPKPQYSRVLRCPASSKNRLERILARRFSPEPANMPEFHPYAHRLSQ